MDEKQAISALSALGQFSRQRVFRALVGAGTNGLPAGEIAEAAPEIARNTMSTHLGVLVRSGLVRSRRDGRSIRYAIDLEVTQGLLKYLVNDCCDGHPQLCAPLLEIVDSARTKNASAPLLSLPEGSKQVNVLFLCAANSARSILAEVLLNSVGGDRFVGYSAGSEPADEPMPEILAHLRDRGHDTSKVRSKSWGEFEAAETPRIDYVIALCDILQDRRCPEFGSATINASWPLPDPRKFNGSPVERRTFISELYVSLRRRIEIFTNLPFDELIASNRTIFRDRLNAIGCE